MFAWRFEQEDKFERKQTVACKCHCATRPTLSQSTIKTHYKNWQFVKELFGWLLSCAIFAMFFVTKFVFNLLALTLLF